MGRAVTETLTRVQAAGGSVVFRGVGSAEMDITSESSVAAVLGEFAPDVVINCAAYTAVDDAETDEDSALRVNADGPANLARATAASGSRLIHVSTDYVFDGQGHTPYPADAPTGPNTAYGRTKLAGEEAVRRLDPSAHIVRTAWVYTGWGYVDGGTDFVATMRRLEGERETINVVDDQRGSPTYAPDLAAGLVELAGLAADTGLVLHATNAGEATWWELARAVFEGVGADPDRVRPCSSSEFPRPAPRPAYSVLSGGEWSAFGLTPLRDWRDALHAALSK